MSCNKMCCGKIEILCFLLVCFGTVTIAQRIDVNKELLKYSQMKSNNKSSANAGPLESHEAMNNRDLYPKSREKRSYEFLMGLINSNSRYEVTKVDSELVAEKTMISKKENIPAATELLLELMVKIAAYPDNWDKVHKLLQSIDHDLITSRNILQNMKPSTKASTTIKIAAKTNKIVNKIESISANTKMNRDPDNGHRSQSILSVSKEEQLNWPVFDNNNNNNTSLQFVNRNNTNSDDSIKDYINDEKYQWDIKSTHSKSPYPKNFAYHRVTGKPINLRKSPKAYIAVSIIAPKPASSISNEEDLTLENELHQLKPWTHIQNLQNMASIRKRWILKNEENSNKQKAT